MNMIVDKFAMAVRHFVAKDQGRPVLTGVAIKGAKAYAANGFVLGEIDLPLLRHERGGEIQQSPVDPGVILSPDAVAAIVKAKGSTTLTQDGIDLTLSQGNIMHQMPAILGTFPDADQIFRNTPVLADVTIDAKYFKQVALAFLELGRTGFPVRMAVRGCNEPVVFSGAADGRRMRVVVMPMVIGAEGSGDLSWAYGSAPEPDPVDESKE